MLAVLAAASAAIQTASAATAPKGGPIALFATISATSAPGKIALAGAIGDLGEGCQRRQERQAGRERELRQGGEWR
jgi:hypothetical protein